LEGRGPVQPGRDVTSSLGMAPRATAASPAATTAQPEGACTRSRHAHAELEALARSRHQPGHHGKARHTHATTHKRSHKHTQARTSTHKHAQARTSTHKHAQARTSTHKHAQARTSTRKHAQARAPTGGHTRTRHTPHKHTHTNVRGWITSAMEGPCLVVSDTRSSTFTDTCKPPIQQTKDRNVTACASLTHKRPKSCF
jgi:hypothetical protein